MKEFEFFYCSIIKARSKINHKFYYLKQETQSYYTCLQISGGLKQLSPLSLLLSLNHHVQEVLLFLLKYSFAVSASHHLFILHCSPNHHPGKW